jgi:hypothetical protein
VTFKFPSAMAAARRTLVAATVNVHPVPEALPGETTPARARRDVICRIDATGPGRDCMVSTESLIGSVEETLAQMQASLDRLKGDVDEEIESYKFPVIEDERPRAA